MSSSTSNPSALVQRGVATIGILLILSSILAGAEDGSDRRSFPLQDLSGVEVVDLGSTSLCRNEPDPNVAYPAFVSGKPLYGVIYVDGKFGTADAGTAYPFAIDESSGTDSGYDRLYIDLNRDDRLSDETPIKPLRELPQDELFTQKWGAHRPSGSAMSRFRVPTPPETQSLQTVPRLLINSQGQATLSFTATKARQGTY